MRRPMDVDTNITVAVTLALATLFTFARFWARYITKVKLWLDDWFALAAYLTGMAWSIIIVVWTIMGGLGREMTSIDLEPDEAIRRSSIFTVAAELFYAFSLACSKFAILGMYWRLFSTSPIRLPIQVLTGMSLIWVIIRTFMTIFHCVPPQAFWDKSIDNARCDIDNSKFFFGTTLTHLIIDVAILLLPVIQVRRLKLRTGQKIGVICLFMFGTVVCVAAIVLLIIATNLDSHSPELPYDIVGIMLPATIEVNLAVVSACLPTIRPVIQRIIPNSVLASDGPSSTSRTYGKTGTNGGVRTGTSGVKLRTLTTGTAIELDDDSSTKNFSDRHYTSSRAFDDAETGSAGSNDDELRPGPRTVIKGGAEGRPTSSQHGPIDGGIMIKNEMKISYEER